MALLCGIQCGNLYTFHVALSHVYKLYTQGKIMLQMSVLPWLTPTELLFQVLGAVSSFASAKCCPSRLGRYLVPISARKMFPVFCQIVSLCCWDTYKMCAKIWGSWTENFCVSVTQNRSVHGTDSRSISLKKKENYFNSDPWICLLNRIIKLLWS